MPVLLQHMSDHIGLHLYNGNRTALPKRVRAFIDLAIQRLLNTSAYVLSERETPRRLHLRASRIGAADCRRSCSQCRFVISCSATTAG